MEQILVNDIEIYTTPYDDYDIIIKKYCLEKFEKGIILDSRFLPIYTGEEIFYPLKTNMSFTFTDISDKITSFRNEKDFSIKTYIDFFKNNIEHNYLLTIEQFIMYELMINGIPQSIERLTELRSIDNLLFGSKHLIASSIDDFRKSLLQTIDEYKNDIREWSYIYNQLIKYNPVEFSEIIDDEKTYQIILNKDVNLFELFENSILSEKTPFLVLKYNEKYVVNMYTKIRNKDFPPEQWLEECKDDLNKKYRGNDGNDKSYILMKLVDGNNFQNPINVMIYSRYIEYTNNLNEENDIILNKIMKCLQRVITRDNISKIVTTKIKGDYYFDNINIERYVFLHLILNNEVLQYFLRVDENDKTSLEKDKFHLTFQRKKSPFEQNYVLSNQDEDEFRTKIRITNVNTINIIQQSQFIMSYLIGMYQFYFDYVVKLYESYGVKQDIKRTKKIRLTKNLEIKHNQLALADPYLFQTNYAKYCSFDKQPFVVKGENQDEVLQNVDLIRRSTGITETVIEFPENSGNWYSCININNLENAGKERHIYVGLKDYKILNQEGELESVFAPCCYKTLNSVKKTFESYEKNEEKKRGKKGGDYILANNKNADLHRYGNAHHNFLQFFDILNIPIEKGGKKGNEHFTIQRYGVDNCTSSMIACMIYARDENFAKLSANERMERILKERFELLKENLLLISQEVYDIDKDKENNKVQELILDYKKYDLDPTLFLRIIETKYKVNILMTSNGDDKLGDIVIPNHSKVYIKHPFNEDWPFVIVNIFYFENTVINRAINRQFQCELYRDKTLQTFLFDKEHIFVKLLIELQSEAYKLDVIAPLADNRFLVEKYVV